MEREMLDKLLEQEILIKELKEENFVLISQLNVEQPDYKERIDKAIKLIEDDYFEDGSGHNIDEVLVILKGEDK